ncbi:sensor histidine kinase [Microcella sp.]|uniref:sensor histidine kinase n=1 Tax=Microcella sp. TaxID=1913979 RepID=UPI003919401E
MTHAPRPDRDADVPVDPRVSLLSPRLTARLLQGVFAVIFLAATLLLLVIEPAIVATPAYLIGGALIGTATALVLIPAMNVPNYQPWMLALPVLDYVAFAIIRTESTGAGTNPMVMMLTLPAIWAGLMRSRWALATIAALSVAVIVPDLYVLSLGTLSGRDADRAIMLIAMLPLVMVLGAIAAYTMANILVGRQTALQRERERRTAAAAESERIRFLLDTVVDSLAVGVIVTDREGELVLMNRILRESPELSANGADPWERYKNSPAFEADGSTPVPQEQSTYARVVRGETVSERLIWVGPPDGEQRALSISGSPVRTAAGEHIANVIIITEVTEYLRALRAKDAFIGTVSHELRTPLTTVTGVLELFDEYADNLPGEVAEWLPVLQRNVARQHVLVRDLLTAAGSKAGTVMLERTPGDLLAVVTEAVSALTAEADRKSITLTLDGDAAFGTFDPSRLAQVAENLIANAVRYTRPGGTVVVRTRTVDDELELSVRDTGVGISDTDKERLFEQFFRSDSARSSAIRGIGLGLAIVKAIVDAHRGRIAIDSELGVGTTVTVRLPRD